jgi:hypothetical protein
MGALGREWPAFQGSPVPLLVEGIPPAKALYVGGFGGTNCVIDADDHAHCWGGYAITDESRAVMTPEPWYPDQRFLDLAPGKNHVCGLTLDRRVFCAGQSDLLGRGPDNKESGFVNIDEAVDTR